MLGFVSSLKVRHCLTFATGLFECLCFAGSLFGWASLVFVLKTEGYFSSLCVITTEVNATQVSGQFDIPTSITVNYAIISDHYLCRHRGLH